MGHDYTFQIRANGQSRRIGYQELVKLLELEGDTDSRGIRWTRGITPQALALQGVIAQALGVKRDSVEVHYQGGRLF